MWNTWLWWYCGEIVRVKDASIQRINTDVPAHPLDGESIVIILILKEIGMLCFFASLLICYSSLVHISSVSLYLSNNSNIHYNKVFIRGTLLLLLLQVYVKRYRWVMNGSRNLSVITYNKWVYTYCVQSVVLLWP